MAKDNDRRSRHIEDPMTAYAAVVTQVLRQLVEALEHYADWQPHAGSVPALDRLMVPDWELHSAQEVLRIDTARQALEELDLMEALNTEAYTLADFAHWVLYQRSRSRSGVVPSMPEVAEALRRVEALTTQFQALSALLDAPTRGDADGTMHRKETHHG